MATDYCKYHPLTTAKWHCASCCLNVCDECAPAGGDLDAAPHCMLCNQPLLSMNSTTTVEPFWHRYTHFLQLPFGVTGSAVLLVLTVVPVLSPAQWLLPVAAGCYLLLALFGWSLLQQAARGDLRAPSPATIGRSLGSLGAQLAVLISAFMTGLMVLTSHSLLLALCVGAGAALLSPLAFMVVATEKSLAALIRPDAWLGLLRPLQFMYLPAGLSSLALFIVLQALVSILADVLTPGLQQGLRNAVYGYGLWVLMAVSGYLLYQYQGLLNFQVEGARRGKVRRTAVRRLDPVQAKLEVFLKEGLYDRAEALLRLQAEKHKTVIEHQERYFNLLVFLQDKEAVAWQGENYMGALLNNQQTDEALKVLAKVQLLMPDFRPEDPDVVFNLAKACVEHRDFARAASVLNGLHQTSPHYPQLPEAYMLRAKVLHEKLQQSAAALEVMEFLVARFQKHPRFAAMQAYWKQLGGRDTSTDFEF